MSPPSLGPTNEAAAHGSLSCRSSDAPLSRFGLSPASSWAQQAAVGGLPVTPVADLKEFLIQNFRYRYLLISVLDMHALSLEKTPSPVFNMALNLHVTVETQTSSQAVVHPNTCIAMEQGCLMSPPLPVLLTPQREHDEELTGCLTRSLDCMLVLSS